MSQQQSKKNIDDRVKKQLKEKDILIWKNLSLCETCENDKNSCIYCFFIKKKINGKLHDKET